MFTLGTISCKDQTSDMQTSLWEGFQHFTLPLTLQGLTDMELPLTVCDFWRLFFLFFFGKETAWVAF